MYTRNASTLRPIALSNIGQFRSVSTGNEWNPFFLGGGGGWGGGSRGRVLNWEIEERPILYIYIYIKCQKFIYIIWYKSDEHESPTFQMGSARNGIRMPGIFSPPPSSQPPPPPLSPRSPRLPYPPVLSSLVPTGAKRLWWTFPRHLRNFTCKPADKTQQTKRRKTSTYTC